MVRSDAIQGGRGRSAPHKIGIRFVIQRVFLAKHLTSTEDGDSDNLTLSDLKIIPLLFNNIIPLDELGLWIWIEVLFILDFFILDPLLLSK